MLMMMNREITKYWDLMWFVERPSRRHLYVNAQTLEIMYFYVPTDDIHYDDVEASNALPYPISIGICPKCVNPINARQKQTASNSKIASKGRLILVDNTIICSTCGEILTTFGDN